MTGGYGPHLRRLIRTPVQGGYPRYHSILSPPRRASLLVPLPLDLSASLPPEFCHYLLCFFLCGTRCRALLQNTANRKSLLSLRLHLEVFWLIAESEMPIKLHNIYTCQRSVHVIIVAILFTGIIRNVHTKLFFSCLPRCPPAIKRTGMLKVSTTPASFKDRYDEGTQLTGPLITALHVQI